MTDAATLIALAERVEGHSETENKLNEEIALVAGWQKLTYENIWFKAGGFDDPEYRIPPDFLSSADAAMTIIPSEWSISCLEWWPIQKSARARLLQNKKLGGPSPEWADENCRIVVTAATLPRAITTAALRAQAKEMG